MDEVLSRPRDPNFFRNRTLSAFEKSTFNPIDGWVNFRHTSGRIASNTPDGLRFTPLILNDKSNGSVVTLSTVEDLIEKGWGMV